MHLIKKEEKKRGVRMLIRTVIFLAACSIGRFQQIALLLIFLLNWTNYQLQVEFVHRST